MLRVVLLPISGTLVRVLGFFSGSICLRLGTSPHGSHWLSPALDHYRCGCTMRRAIRMQIMNTGHMNTGLTARLGIVTLARVTITIWRATPVLSWPNGQPPPAIRPMRAGRGGLASVRLVLTRRPMRTIALSATSFPKPHRRRWFMLSKAARCRRSFRATPLMKSLSPPSVAGTRRADHQPRRSVPR